MRECDEQKNMVRGVTVVRNYVMLYLYIPHVIEKVLVSVVLYKKESIIILDGSRYHVMIYPRIP